MMKQVFIKKGAGRQFKAGGSWIYDNEIERIEDGVTDGDIVEVHDFDDYFLGYGYINRKSVITIRIMSKHKDVPVDEALIERRCKDAYEYRKKVVDLNCCRLIFGEADFLPGIVVDKYSDCLVVQSLTLGIERFKLMIVDKLKSILAEDDITIKGVYERSDNKERTLEGMPMVKDFIGEPFDTKVNIIENGVKYYVDVADGQKTGFFLDQKYNRLAIHPFSKGAKVLDCFTHTGSFALNAAFAGAKHVTAVDASDTAIEMAKANAVLNGFEDRMDFICEDVFELLPRLYEEKETYDLVILDPPAFTKSRKSVKNATNGYRDINIRGMKLVKNGGFLATCSCSHFMTPELFTNMLMQAAKSAHKRLRQVEYRTQSSDHPILWSNDESLYLKFYIFQVVDEI
ncbi:MAG TPA: rRNA large subunit methyltransferase I [Eubacterium sp.]|nr:rRNA large subunit methyltransferase I [Eubacterium sp.]